MKMTEYIRPILLTVLLVFSSAISWCQRPVSGDFSIVSKEKFIDVKIDFSQTIFEGKYNLKQYLAVCDVPEINWKVASEEMQKTFLRHANSKLRRYKLLLVPGGLTEDSFIAPSGFIKARYTLILCPITSNELADMELEYRIFDNTTSSIIAVARGTVRGSLLNSIETKCLDSMEDAGDSFGKFIRKYL